ncbi:hypothetical protein K6U06_09515 [Acidiferrimicrobium sp. IK]|uniref:uridine kinase family protein n=1 Tax=Acidiferrimicrobium sp. IK TaxID=2871700 RepID=UPI0021CAF95D|nr:hypothetical protein [Acidiferrimicrobium sp. IK]MCU4184595.1 hypothetical protein [Acidiferrimicrobium sp. IK]
MGVITYAVAADWIRGRTAPVLPRLVAVDGPSGSGKSTFAAHLAAALGDAEVVEIDDFVSWDNLAGWWPRLETEVLGPLLAGDDAVYQQRDWAGDPLGDRLGGWRPVAGAPVVILEGVTASRQAIADRLTLAVWVEAPAEVRLERGVRRDGEAMRSRWVEWMRREDAFFATDRTRDRAHLHVDGAPAISPGATRWFAGQFSAARGARR